MESELPYGYTYQSRWMCLTAILLCLSSHSRHMACDQWSVRRESRFIGNIRSQFFAVSPQPFTCCRIKCNQLRSSKREYFAFFCDGINSNIRLVHIQIVIYFRCPRRFQFRYSDSLIRIPVTDGYIRCFSMCLRWQHTITP